MRVVVDRPPLFDEIDKAFGVAGRGVIFCWGSTIFNPMNVNVGLELLAHEAVHCERQGSDIEGWWRRYIAEPSFRLAEEIPAHRVEYRALCGLPGVNRGKRRFYLAHVAKRLASPLYGGLIGLGEAKKMLLA